MTLPARIDGALRRLTDAQWVPQLLVLGLFTRLVSIPLFINMLVATLAVRLKKVGGLDDFVELDEPLYALTFLWLFFSGPGWVSLDHLLGRALRKKYARQLEPKVPA